MIGLAATLFFATLGRTAGVSGILGGFVGRAPGTHWRAPFLLGLMTAGAVARAAGIPLYEPIPRSWPALAIAGLIVGFGTRLGGGCTSGHGVCGVSRFAPRSIAATLIFMASGAATVFIVARFFGGIL